jgi:hypothetical protein
MVFLSIFVLFSLVILQTINGSVLTPDQTETQKDTESLKFPDNVYDSLFTFKILQKVLKEARDTHLPYIISTIASLTPKEQVYWWVCFASEEQHREEDSDYNIVTENLKTIFSTETSEESKARSWSSLAKIADNVIVLKRHKNHLTDAQYSLFANKICSFQNALKSRNESSSSEDGVSGDFDGSAEGDFNQYDDEEERELFLALQSGKYGKYFIQEEDGDNNEEYSEGGYEEDYEDEENEEEFEIGDDHEYNEENSSSSS